MASARFQSVVGGAVVLIVGLYIVASLFGTMPADEFHQVENESLTQDVGNWTQVSETYGSHYYENETVNNSSNTTLVEGTDYEWNPDNQSVYFYATANTNDGATAYVTYSFDAKPEMARTSVGTIGDAFSLGAVAVLVFVAVFILQTLGGFSGAGGGRGRR